MDEHDEKAREPLQFIFTVGGSILELQILDACIQAVERLEDDMSRRRVVHYLNERFGGPF